LEQIRILVVAMPRMLQGIIESVVSSQPDMTLVGPARRNKSVAAAARRVRADIVILGESQEDIGGTPWQVLNENPRLKIVTISPDGHRATRYEMRPHQVDFDDVSPEGLIHAIRAAMADRAR
jgi:chemotaxis response regulator CheB